MHTEQIRTSLIMLAALLGCLAQLQASSGSIARVIRDVQYYTGADSDPKYHSLDLYLPEGGTDLPVVLWVHGGGWRAGDKASDFGGGLADLFLGTGLGVASCNYRLSPAARHPEHIRDVARAFAWLHRNATEYGLDPDRIFVAGISAGGHLGSLLALDAKHLAKEGLSPKRIAGVMTISGVYDLANFPEPGIVPPRKEQAFGVEREGLREASPLAYIAQNSEIPPFLITFTDNDIYGIGEQAKRFYSLLLRHAAPVELVEIPDRTHFNQIPGITRKLPRTIESWNDSAQSPRVMEASFMTGDVLGPALKRFVQGILSGSLPPTEILKRPAPATRIVKDIQYYEGPDSDPGLNALDLYLPEKTATPAVVLYVHGGGWRRGDKRSEGFENFVATFARRGVAVASTNYRLSPAVEHPVHIQDVARALAWLKRNGRNHGIDPERLLLAGTSAGAHLVSLLALHPNYLKEVGLSTDSIRGVIAISGVYDLVNFAEPGVDPPRMQEGFGYDLESLRDASPAYQVDSKAPPFLITCTDHDLFTLREEALRFWDLLVSRGIQADFVEVPDRSHFNIISGMGRQVGQVDDVIAAAFLRFLDQVLPHQATE